MSVEFDEPVYIYASNVERERRFWRIQWIKFRIVCVLGLAMWWIWEIVPWSKLEDLSNTTFRISLAELPTIFIGFLQPLANGWMAQNVLIAVLRLIFGVSAQG